MVNRNLISGQSFFEVTVVIMIVSLVITAMAGMALLSVKASIYARARTAAGRYNQEAVEWLRGERDKSWTDFSANALGRASTCMQTLAWAPDCSAANLTRAVNFESVSVNEIKATVIVTWMDSGGTHESNSVTIFSNWQGK